MAGFFLVLEERAETQEGRAFEGAAFSKT